jgi:hypothetical protein
MMQFQQQTRQQQQNRNAGLAAAFGFEKPQPLSKQQQRQSLAKQASPMPEEQPQQQQEQPQEQQIVHQQQQPITQQKTKCEAAEFLEKNGVPTFVPVYASTNEIEPRVNEPAKGQVPWKCAHCGAHSFGHHCMGCVRHRDQAALRVFIGQLCKENAPGVVEKMVEVLLPELSQPHLYIEQHTDARSGHGKGCVWLYVHCVQDIVYAVKALNKRTFLTVEENSGNVGFVAFPASFTNQEIEQAFQLDHEAQDDHIKSLFMFTVISAQVPKNLQGMIAAFTGRAQHQHQQQYNNGMMMRSNQQQQFAPRQQQQQQFVAPSLPTYGASLPPPPQFAGVNKFHQQQQQQQQFQQFGSRVMMQQQQQMIPDISCAPQMDNRQIEEQQLQQQQQQPVAYLGQQVSHQHSHHAHNPYSYGKQNQQSYPASWKAQASEDNHFGGYY